MLEGHFLYARGSLSLHEMNLEDRNGDCFLKSEEYKEILCKALFIMEN